MGPIFWDIDEIFGVFTHSFKELILFFDFSKVIFGEILFESFPGRDSGSTPDFTNGFRGEGNIFQILDLFGAQTFIFFS